jgi:hypothetical protein
MVGCKLFEHGSDGVQLHSMEPFFGAAAPFFEQHIFSSIRILKSVRYAGEIGIHLQPFAQFLFILCAGLVEWSLPSGS